MGYRVVHALSDRQIEDLVALYANEFWCSHRTLADVRRMLGHTDLIVGVIDDTDRLVAFCRVLTDFVYRATLFDVIVAPARRGEGLGKQLMDAMLSHPKLAGVESIDLSCRPEMTAFYEYWGFTTDLKGTLFMRRRAVRNG
jgi:predicted GNAT family N-acyltransferase